MMLLTPILLVPLVAGLLCLLVRSRRLMEGLNVLAFALALALGLRLLPQVLERGIVTEWKEFLYAFVFISSDKLMTLPVGLAQKIFGDIYPWGLLMAASLVISLPVVVFYMYGQRFMIAGLTAGSVKG